jgi:hypothetical protein
MSTEKRVSEGTLCDQCHDPKKPLTEANSQNISYQLARDSEGRRLQPRTFTKERAAWIKANR